MALARRARKRRLGIEDEYWHLMLAGWARWRPARWWESVARPAIGGGPSVGGRGWRAVSAPASRGNRSERYLGLLERQRIASLRRQGLSMREIGHRLGRSPSTISRQLRRNSAANDVGADDADLAH